VFSLTPLEAVALVGTAVVLSGVLYAFAWSGYVIAEIDDPAAVSVLPELLLTSGGF
jgi:hypothetical protein